MIRKNYRYLRRAQVAFELRKQLAWLKKLETKCVVDSTELNEHISLIQEIENRIQHADLLDAREQVKACRPVSDPSHYGDVEPQEVYGRHS